MSLNESELATYEAVRMGLPRFRELTQDADGEVRRWAACLLGWLPSPENIPHLAALIADDVVGVASTAVVSLGLNGGTDSVARAFTDPRPAVRGAAAIALARLHGEHAPAEAVEELLRWASRESMDDGETTDIAYFDGDLPGYAALALSEVLPDESEAAFDALLRRIPAVSGMEALPVVGEALRRAFVAGPLLAGAPFSVLTRQQQRLLQVLAASPTTWRIGGFDGEFANFTLLIVGYGLPSDPAMMFAYVNAPD